MPLFAILSFLRTFAIQDAAYEHDFHAGIQNYKMDTKLKKNVIFEHGNILQGYAPMVRSIISHAVMGSRLIYDRQCCKFPIQHTPLKHINDSFQPLDGCYTFFS